MKREPPDTKGRYALAPNGNRQSRRCVRWGARKQVPNTGSTSSPNRKIAQTSYMYCTQGLATRTPVTHPFSSGQRRWGPSPILVRARPLFKPRPSSMCLAFPNSAPTAPYQVHCAQPSFWKEPAGQFEKYCTHLQIHQSIYKTTLTTSIAAIFV